jgi:hypothetical protein
VKQPFRPAKGGIRVSLAPAERAILRQLPGLLDSVAGPSDDPAAARLRPSAYPDDPDAEDEFRRLMAGELEEARRTDRAGFLEDLSGRGVLDEERAGAWLRILSESRLVLAARLGIEEDGWEESMPGSDPEVTLLHYLGWLQEELIGAMEEP